MLKLINDLPQHVIGIHAFADVTHTEYKGMLIPLLENQLKKVRKLNFVLVLETDIENFESGAWCGSIKIGLKHFFRWNRVAIVTDQKRVLGYSDLFKYVVPGKFKKLPLDHIDKAIRWVSER